MPGKQRLNVELLTLDINNAKFAFQVKQTHYFGKVKRESMDCVGQTPLP